MAGLPKRSIRPVVQITILLFFAGCGVLGKSTHPGASPFWAVHKNMLTEEEKKHKLNLAVVPFAEKRGNLKSYGSVYRYLIPLVPYGTIRYERPDQGRMFNTENEFEFNMSENLMKVIIDALKKSDLFNTVILTPTPLESKADVILSGEIYSTLYEGKTYSYGISFLGPVLWCFGLPAGSSHKKLNIMLYLKKTDSRESLWSYNLKKEKTLIQGLYHNWGKDINSFVTLMDEGTKEAIADLHVTLSKIPIEQLKYKPKDELTITPQEKPDSSLEKETLDSVSPSLKKEVPALGLPVANDTTVNP